MFGDASEKNSPVPDCRTTRTGGLTTDPFCIDRLSKREREEEIESPHQTDINYKCVCVFLVIDCLTKGNGRRTSQTYCSLIGQPVNIDRSFSFPSLSSALRSRIRFQIERRTAIHNKASIHLSHHLSTEERDFCFCIEQLRVNSSQHVEERTKRIVVKNKQRSMTSLSIHNKAFRMFR